MSELRKEQNILRQLVKSREAIRRKYNILKRNKDYIKKTLGETFKPIVDPLDKLVTLTEKKKKNFISNDKVLTPVKFSQKIDQNIIAPEPTNSDTDDDDGLPYETAGSDDEASQTVVETDIENEASKTIVENDTLLNRYLQMTIPGSAKKYLDKIYGVHNKNNKLFFGDSEISFKSGKVFVKDQEYPISTGRLELLFTKEPNLNVITQDDLSIYRKMLKTTNSHKKRFNFDSEIRRHKSRKFNSIIAPLFELKSGRGFLPRYKVARFNSFKDYVYWDDPNELVDRLRLLVAERAAGNNAHTNEIHSIIEELREGVYIY